MTAEKDAVQDFWNDAACGEVYATGPDFGAQMAAHAAARYRLEPEILTFARFSEGRGKDVLEIGVGMGADHLEWAKAVPRTLAGIDLTSRAVEITRRRFSANGFHANVLNADAESLPFAPDSFDIVYAYGCLHHSPDTPQAVREVHRVLRRGGTCRVMIYHSASPVGWLLWVRYALLRGRPITALSEIYAKYLESPGTKAYTRAEARQMFADFSNVTITVKLGFGDLLLGEVGQRHRGPALSITKQLWPRWLLRRFDGLIGLGMFIEARK